MCYAIGMKKLIVAEKPSVARDIARVIGASERRDGYLEGENYIVTWALGHLVSLMEPDELDERYKRWNMADLPILPEEIPLKVLPKTRSQFSVIRKLMRSQEVSSIICATDAAREGELIFRYIYQKAGCTKPVERLWISSMTDRAIRQGFSELKSDSAYDALYESARCRSLADWLVGMNASRAFTLRYGVLLPMGRVQTPTLNLLVKRDREIAQFVPADYWEIRANFGDFEGLWWNPQTKDLRAPSREVADAVKKQTQGREGEIVQSACETKRQPPPQLFDLTSLQRAANKRFGFSAEKTLKLAQSLYEKHKLLTYPRTDSRHLPEDMRPKILKALSGLPSPWREWVQSPQFHSDLRSKRFYDASKVSDHHAIVPTEKRPGGALSPDEAKIYDMVVRSLIAAHYPDYTYESTKLSVQIGPHEFRASGSVPVDPGWKAVYGSEAEEKPEKQLPKLSPGDRRTAEKVTIKKQSTKPPAPHTDATLLNLMEHAGRDLEDEELRERMKSSGLGTPATRAATIERLIAVGLAKRQGKSIVSTEKGQKLIAVAPEQIASAATTGKWEKALYALAQNPDEASRHQKAQRFMQGIRKFSLFLVEAARTGRHDVQFEREPYKKKPTKRGTQPK